MSGTDQCTGLRYLQLVVVSIVVLSVCTDVAGFLRFAPSLGLPTWSAVLCVIPTKLVEWTFLVFGARLWRQCWLGKIQSPVYVAIWAIAVVLSALAAYGTIFGALAATDNGAATRTETRANLATALARANAQLDSFPKPLPRPVGTIEQELGWAASVPMVTRRCLRNAQAAARDEDCSRVIALRKELAVAQGYERLAHESEKLREQLAGISIGLAHDPMPHAFDVTLGRLLSIDGRSGVALLGMLMLTLVSAFGPFGLDTLRRPAQPALAGSSQCTDPILASASGQVALGAQVIQFRSGDRPPKPVANPSGKSAQSRHAGTSEGIPKRPQRRSRASAHQCAGPARGRVDYDSAIAAIRAFVGKLEQGKQGRATGSQLASAYAAQRWRFGWPALPANVIGMHLKTVIEELGGRKIKSGVQVYEGVRLPAAWCEPCAQSA